MDGLPRWLLKAGSAAGKQAVVGAVLIGGLLMTVGVTSASASVNAVAINFRATAGVGFSGEVATFTTFGEIRSSPNYSTAIDWGDGSANTTGMVRQVTPDEFRVSGTHTFGAGQFRLSVSITDVTTRAAIDVTPIVSVSG